MGRNFSFEETRRNKDLEKKINLFYKKMIDSLAEESVEEHYHNVDCWNAYVDIMEGRIYED